MNPPIATFRLITQTTSEPKAAAQTLEQAMFHYGDRTYVILRDPADRFVIWDVKCDRPIIRDGAQLSYETASDARRAIERQF